MKYTFLFITFLATTLLSGCGSQPAANNSNAGNTAAAPAIMNLTTAETPQRIKDMMAKRGEQDSASPVLKFVAPVEGATVESSTVRVVLNISGDLKGYEPHMDPETRMGNHIHVILDNQPYEAYYNIGLPFELRNVPDGEHTLRVFASRPWHESYKNDGSFQIVKFVVKKGGADVEKPATTNTGQQMSNSNSNVAASSNGNAAPTPEGKDMPASTGGAVDSKKPLLTYSRPKGEYKAADADPVMIDFWLTGCKLSGDGGDCRVRYSVDGGEAKFIEKWAPLWLSGWAAGKHSVKLELVDKDGNVVDNGGYNSTTREISVVK